MDLKGLFALAVAIVMFSSIAAYTVFYTFPDQKSSSGNNDVPQNPTAIDFKASGVSATVVNLLPSIEIWAETTETDLLKVNKSIYSVDGIKTVNGKFQQHPYSVLGMGFVYVADISFAPDKNSSGIIGALESETSLRYVSGSNYALVELPKKITMQSADAKLGLARDFNFSENLSEALIGLDAMEGDSLLVGVSATFVGNEATNVMALEEKNLTAEPVPKTALLQAPVGSLEPKLAFDADLPYSLFDGVSSLEKDLNAIEGVSGSKVFFSAVEPVLSIGGQADENAFAQLQSFLNDLNASNVSLTNNPLSGTISFSESIGSKAFSEKKAAIEAKVKQLDLNAFVAEENGLLSAEISLASVDSKQPASLVSNLLKSKLLVFNLRQPGTVALLEIKGPEPESSALYSVPAGKISSMLLPGHSLSDIVSVEASFSLVRGKIDSISAEEKK